MTPPLVKVLGGTEANNLKYDAPSVEMFDGEIWNHYLRTQVHLFIFSYKFPVGVRPFPLLGKRPFHIRVGVTLCSVV
jgi:hypothetical protein